MEIDLISPRATQPSVHWILEAFCQLLKQPGHEADHSPSCIVKVKSTWSDNLISLYIIIARGLITGTLLVPFT